MTAETNETGVLSNAERQARFRANKAYKSLPPDVQHTIDRISTSPEEREQRIAIALDFQVKHPGSRHMGIDYDSQPRGAAKPGDVDYREHPSYDEYCKVCDITLCRLELPRLYPGTCLTCVMKETA